MRRDRRGTRTIEPEALARLGADRDETLGLAGVGQSNHLGGRSGDRLFIVAHQIRNQHHLRAIAACRLGRVIDGLHIALVEVLEPGDLHVGQAFHKVDDLDDGRDCGAKVGTEELQAHGAHVGRHPMQHETRRGDEAVAALLLDPGQAGQELVGDVFAQAGLAERLTGHREELRFAFWRAAVGRVAPDPKAHRLLLVDLGQVVVEALDLEPVGLRGHHAPAHQIVERGAPKHRLLAAGVHRDVAADGRGVL